jgi:2',3'-cyclic-nucleotide 2'-phosphodiesterase (5'-nucleotidase family)
VARDACDVQGLLGGESGLEPRGPPGCTSVSMLIGALVVVLAAVLAGCGGGERTVSGERAPACPPGAGPPRGTTVTLFHETHTHGELTGAPDRPRAVTFDRYVGLRNALRACLKPASSLFLGNGDDLSGALAGVATDGRHTIDAFNAAGIDADTFGFSEFTVRGETPDRFEASLARLRELVAASRFAWVSANVREVENPDEVLAAAQGAHRWIVREVGGVRIGITGLLGRVTHGWSMGPPPGGDGHVRVLEPVRAIREVLPEMRAAGAQIVVVLSHMIHEDTVHLLRRVKGIDVALGTHLGPPLPQPLRVRRSIVAIAGPSDMTALGQLDLTIRSGRIVDYAFARHIPAPAGPIDRRVRAALARYARPRASAP